MRGEQLDRGERLPPILVDCRGSRVHLELQLGPAQLRMGA